MAEDSKQESSEKQKPPDDGTPKWVKTAAGVIGILVTLFGLLWQFYTFQQHFQEEATKQAQAKADVETAKAKQSEQDREKAQILKDTAALQLADEKIKLDIANNQLKQHLADTALDLNKRKLDIARDEKNRISLLINQMFDPKTTSSEGTLALLSEYAAGDGEYKKVILNALAARLSDCKSTSEVRLIYRLLVQIGPESLDTVIQSNRNARRDFDAGLLDYFWQAVAEELKPENKKKLVASYALNREAQLFEPIDNAHVYAAESVLNEASKRIHTLTLSIDPAYRSAVIASSTRYTAFPIPPQDYHIIEAVQKFYDDLEQTANHSLTTQAGNRRLDIYSVELTESVLALQELLNLLSKGSSGETLDLSDCFLSGLHIRRARFYSVTLDGTYVYKTKIGPGPSNNNDSFDHAITVSRVPGGVPATTEFSRVGRYDIDTLISK